MESHTTSMANKHRVEDYHPEDYTGVKHWTRAEIDAVYTPEYLDRLQRACRQVALAHAYGWGALDATAADRKE